MRPARIRKILLGMLIAAAIVAAAGRAGSFLVLNAPHKSDVIIVLAGETDHRPNRGLALLRQGFAKELILDVPAEAKLFQWTDLELARNYVAALPDADRISICPIFGLSTAAEAVESAKCATAVGAQEVLLVTSDYHTRRAISTFRKEAPQFRYSIAAVFDPLHFGTQWWRHREWAKVCIDEWVRLTWWETVDRWRFPSSR